MLGWQPKPAFKFNFKTVGSSPTRRSLNSKPRARRPSPLFKFNVKTVGSPSKPAFKFNVKTVG